MATSLNKVVPQRDSGYQSIQSLRRSFTFNDFPATATIQRVGGLPANAIVVGGGTVVTTALVGSTLNIGYLDYDNTTTDVDAYATLVPITASGFVAIDEIAAITNQPRTVATQVIVSNPTAALTAGVFEVVIFFVTKNPTSGAGA
jgi:hypothetical protein